MSGEINTEPRLWNDCISNSYYNSPLLHILLSNCLSAKSTIHYLPAKARWNLALFRSVSLSIHMFFSPQRYNKCRNINIRTNIKCRTNITKLIIPAIAIIKKYFFLSWWLSVTCVLVFWRTLLLMFWSCIVVLRLYVDLLVMHRTITYP